MAVVRLRVMTEIALWRHGWLWAVFVALLAATAGAAGFARWSLDREARQLEAEAEALAVLKSAAEQHAATAREASAEFDGRAATSAEKQAMLAAVLSPRDQAGDLVRQIYQLAERQQVSIAQADFQSSADATGIERLQVSIPTKASYPQLRRFLEDCLRAVPNASLDRLSFKRNQVGETQIEARVHLSLWLRAGDEGAVPMVEPAGRVEVRP